MISFGNYSKFCQTRSQVIQLKTLSLSRGGFSHLWVRWETIVVKPTPTESHGKSVQITKLPQTPRQLKRNII